MSELASESGWVVVGSDSWPSTTLSCCPSHALWLSSFGRSPCRDHLTLETPKTRMTKSPQATNARRVNAGDEYKSGRRVAHAVSRGRGAEGDGSRTCALAGLGRDVFQTSDPLKHGGSPGSRLSTGPSPSPGSVPRPRQIVFIFKPTNPRGEPSKNILQIGDPSGGSHF